MQFAARGLGAQCTIDTPRFEPESAPAGARTGHLLAPRRPAGPDALPTGLELDSNPISKPILENGSNRGASTRVRLEMAPQGGELNRGASSRVSPRKYGP